MILKLLFYIKLLLSKSNIHSKFYEYDKRGVRAFVRYSTASGTWAIECYRRKTKQEVDKDVEDNNRNSDNMKIDHTFVWKMIREGNIMTYNNRRIAELKALELAEAICKEFNY